MSGTKRICVGAFAGAHGVRGEAKVKCFTASSEDIAAYGPVTTEDGRRFTLEVVRLIKADMALVRAPEIASREDAAALAGARLYVDRAALPEIEEEDEFYIEDLVGLAAFTEDGAPAGRVRAVYNFGAGDILELEDVPGIKTAPMIPFTRTAVPEIDLARGRLTVAGAFLAEADDEAERGEEDKSSILRDDTGDLASSDLEADIEAMRQEDA